MTPETRNELIDAFHAQALVLLETVNAAGTNQNEIARLLEDLALTPGIRPDVVLANLHDAGSTATILREGPGGVGALMLLRLPDTAPTPIHNHNTWGVAAVIEGTNRYWRWERLDDLSDHNHADLCLAEEFLHEPGSTVMWGDPPHDLHAQQGVSGDAWEFVFFGRNPNLQPRAYFDAETGRITYASAVTEDVMAMQSGK